MERCRELHFDLGQEEIFAVVFTDVYSAANQGTNTNQALADTFCAL